MIHSKNHKHGFTLLETMMAMMIVGIVLTPMFLLFGTVSKKMNRSSQRLYALIMGKQVLYSARQQQEVEAHEFSLEKKIDEANVTVKYKLEKSINTQSSLAKLDGLHREVLTVEWDHLGKKEKELIVTYVYKKPEQKKT